MMEVTTAIRAPDWRGGEGEGEGKGSEQAVTQCSRVHRNNENHHSAHSLKVLEH